MGRTKRKRNKKNTNFIPERLDSEIEFVKLFQWMVARGWQKKGCGLRLVPAQFPTTGRGLMAAETITANSTIVKIPETLMISENKVLKEIPKLEEFNCTSAEMLAIFLLYCEVNPTSKYSDYISSLPKCFSVAATCTDAEITMLPEDLKEKVERSNKHLFDKYHSIASIWAKIFHSPLVLERFVWAWYAVNTRAVFCSELSQKQSSIKAENHMVLIPMLDLLNHSNEAEIQAGFNKTTRCFEIKTRKRIPKFQEVFINYGLQDSSNTNLWLYYGFIIPKNSMVEFDLQDIVRAKIQCENQSANMRNKSTLNSKNNVKRKDFLGQLSYHKKFFCSREGFSTDTKFALSILACDEESLSKMVHPYDIDITLKEEKIVSIRLAQNLITKFKLSVAKMEKMPNTSQSFDVAKLLLHDMIDVLLYVSANE